MHGAGAGAGGASAGAAVAAIPAMRALLAALLLLLARPALAAAADDEPEAADEPELDDDSDSAPFMIVVEHEAAGGAPAWRCSGSLVSLRTGVTSAECARGRRPQAARELWALAAATAAGLAPRADGARRVSRVAAAGAREQAAPRGSPAWSHALLDLAVLELEMPFGSGARSRPILMATAPGECATGGVCHMVRAVSRATGGRTRLRIVDARLAADAPCAQLVRYWAALRERALCLTGPELCQSEWGAGVVCGGKLCGVVSRSAGGGAPDCGDTHAAQSVARWRRFLHCAHTLRACGRGACAELCHERRLLDEGGVVAEAGDAGGAGGGDTEPPAPSAAPAAPVLRAAPAPSAAPPAPPPRAAASTTESSLHTPFDLAHLAPYDDAERATERASPAETPTRRHPEEVSPRLAARTRVPAALRGAHGRKPTRTAWTPPSTRRARPPPPPPGAPPPLTPPAPAAARAPARPGAPPQLTPASPVSVRPTPLFEPNRPDFRAGEYGDNAAEYGAPGEDAGGGGGGGGVPPPAAPRQEGTPPPPAGAASPPGAPVKALPPPRTAAPPPRAAPGAEPRAHPRTAPLRSAAASPHTLSLPFIIVLAKSFI